jgi:hypothetical protein
VNEVVARTASAVSLVETDGNTMAVAAIALGPSETEAAPRVNACNSCRAILSPIGPYNATSQRHDIVPEYHAVDFDYVSSGDLAPTFCVLWTEPYGEVGTDRSYVAT